MQHNVARQPTRAGTAIKSTTNDNPAAAGGPGAVPGKLDVRRDGVRVRARVGRGPTATAAAAAA